MSIERFVGMTATLATGIETVVLPFNEHHQSDLSEAALLLLLERLQALYPTLVVLSCVEIELAMHLEQQLQQRKLPVIHINARQVADFAQGQGLTSDQRMPNANLLAQFGQAIRPHTTQRDTLENQELNALLSRRLQLIEMLMSEKNRLRLGGGYAASPYVERHVHAHVAWLETALEDVDTRLKPFWLL